jgi:DnaK suppressor protein
MPVKPARAEAAPDDAQRRTLEPLIRERLATLRREIAQALRQSGRPEVSGIANHLEETDDEAIADLENAIEIAAIERDVVELRELEAALARLKTPEYGICIDCGAGIPFARLEVQPAALRCVRCQSLIERTHSVSGGGPKL